MPELVDILNLKSKLAIREWENGQIVRIIPIDVPQPDMKQFFIDEVNKIRYYKNKTWDFTVNGKFANYQPYFGDIEWPVFYGRK